MAATTRTASDAYQPTSIAEAFERIAAGADPRVVVGDFLDDWNRGTERQRVELIQQLVRDPGMDPNLRRWAAFCAAMVEQLCWTNETGRLPVPPWTADPSYRLSEPWFLVPGWSLRAWQLFTTPVPFRARNIFGGDNLLERA